MAPNHEDRHGHQGHDDHGHGAAHGREHDHDHDHDEHGHGHGAGAGRASAPARNHDHGDHAGHGHAAAHRHGDDDHDDHGHDHGHDHYHDHGHDHGHHHGHSHGPPPGGWNRAFAIGIGLNLAFVAIEAGYGLAADSLALLADAGHNFSDVGSLLLAWGATVLAARAPTLRRTYGWRRTTVLASIASGLLLLGAIAVIAIEAVGRLRSPAPVDGLTMMVVAGIGVVINTATALLFMGGRHGDLNIRAAFLHMAADAGISLGVVLGGAGVLLWGLAWLDPVLSLVIAALIGWSTWALLREALDLAVDAVPRGIDPVAVERYLASRPGVVAVHDLHIWGMSTTEVALTAHLVMPAGQEDDFLHAVTDGLRDHFRIPHATLQVERSDWQHGCAPGESRSA
jgi:cobalt-zinc-cadmium efflux system protein